MITAKEAQKISLDNNPLTDVLAAICKDVQSAALKGEMSTVYRYSSNSGLDMYPEPAKRNALTKKLCETLQKLGYRVERYYQEMSIAVDIGLKISWD